MADEAEFPHLYAHLEGENVDSFKDLHKEGKGWAEVFEKPEVKGWMEY